VDGADPSVRRASRIAREITSSSVTSTFARTLYWRETRICFPERRLWP
jgi:hypothetical protein